MLALRQDEWRGQASRMEPFRNVCERTSAATVKGGETTSVAATESDVWSVDAWPVVPGR